MNKLTKKFSILLASVAMATGVGLVGGANSSVAKADDIVYKSSIFSASNNANGTNNYTSTVDNTTDGFSVTVANGHNNSKKWDYFRFGQNKAASKGFVTTKEPIDKTIVKVSVTIGSRCEKVNGIYVYANTTNTFTDENKVGTFTGYAIGTTITADLTGTSENMYYKVEFDMAAGKNGALEVNQIDFIISGSSATADAFIAAIAKIPSVDALTIADKNLVEAARKEYGILTDTLKAQEDVKAALATLEAAEAKMAELEAAAAEEEDVKAAAAVDELINAIGEVTDYSKAAQIKEARAAYDALSENAKTKVTTLATLEAAEEAILEYAPAEVTYEFNKMSGFSTWANSYSKHEDTTTYPDAKLVLASASKQGTTITDYPVTKEQPVEVIMTDGSTLDSVEFTFAQWGSKAQTATLHYSTDGGTTYTSTGVTSSTFAIPTTKVAEGTNAVKVTFSSSGKDVNQIGIVSCKVVKHRDTAATTEQVAANEFIAKWNVYSADYCTNVNDEAKRAEILALIAEYEALDADVKAIVDANIDLTGTAMARSIEYAKNHIDFLNNTATGEGSTGTILSAVTESGASTIAIVAALVLLTFVGYVVISKKKLVK